MGYFIIGGLVFIIVCIGYGLAGGALYLIYLPFRKKLFKNGSLNKKRSRLINRGYIGLIFILAIYSTWTAFFPLDAFYKDEFEFNTGLDFPETGIIIAKDSEYPDLHGDYWASAIIEMDKNEFKILKTKLIDQKGFQIDTAKQKIGISPQYRELTKSINEGEIEIIYLNSEKQWFKVAFMKNSKTIIFERSSS